MCFVSMDAFKNWDHFARIVQIISLRNDNTFSETPGTSESKCSLLEHPINMYLYIELEDL